MGRLYEDAVTIARLYIGMGLALDGWRHIFEGHLLTKIPGTPPSFGSTCRGFGLRQVAIGCRMAGFDSPLHQVGGK